MTLNSETGMRTHIKVVGYAHILYGLLGLLSAAGILFGGLLGGLFSGSLTTLLMAGVSSVVLAIFYGILAMFGLIAAFAFLNHRPWARYVLVLVSILNLFSWPVGTLFSIYALWVLFHRETAAIFRAHEGLA
jgi:hypothetical protein